MSSSLPTLFRRAADYRRQITVTAMGLVVEETAIDPALTDAIRRAYVREVTGFCRRRHARDDARNVGPRDDGPGGMGGRHSS
jgi:hypothetical protein